MQPYQQRVVDEKAELDARLTKLIMFLTTPTFGALAKEEQARMRRQEDLMRDLSMVLGERIAAFR